MTSKIKGLIKRKDGKFTYRAHIPKDLQGEYGRKEIWRSTGTNDRKEAERRVHKIAAELNAEFDEKRRQRTTAQRQSKYLTSPQYMDIAETVRRKAAEAGDPVGGGVHLSIPLDFDGTVEHLEHHREAFDPHDLPDDHDKALREIDDALGVLEAERQSIQLVTGVAEDGEPISVVPIRYVGEVQEFINGLYERERNRILTYRREVEALGDAAEATRAEDDKRLEVLMERWVRVRTPSDKSINDTRDAIRDFRKVNGDVPYDEITKSHIRAFKDHIIELPLAAATKEKRWGALGRILNIAVGDRLLETSPMVGFKLDLKDDAERRVDFTPQDFEAYFRKNTEKDEDWWCFRILMYSGMRLAEVVQLTKDDLRQEGDIWHFDINRSNGKKAKTANSIRKVPVHRQLIADGLLEWIGDRNGPIFSREPKVMSQRLNRRRHAAGIEAPEGYKKDIHSLRHTFISASRPVMDEETRDKIVGHASQRVGRGYGTHDLATLKAAIDKVRYGISGEVRDHG